MLVRYYGACCTAFMKEEVDVLKVRVRVVVPKGKGQVTVVA